MLDTKLGDIERIAGTGGLLDSRQESAQQTPVILGAAIPTGDQSV